MNLPIGARLFQAAFGSHQTCHSVLDRTPAREKNYRAVVHGSQSGLEHSKNHAALGYFTFCLPGLA